MRMSNIIIDVDNIFRRPIYLWTCKKLGRGEILLKKNVNVNKIMVQKLVKENDPIEFLELFVILLKHSSKQEQKDIEKVNKQHEIYEQYKNLNPKYSENIIPLKEAKLKVDSSDIIYSSKYNIFRSY